MKSKRSYIRLISYLSVFCVVLAVAATVFAVRAHKYRFLCEVSAQKAVSELCENLDNITVSLQKGLYCGTKEKLRLIGEELSCRTGIAKVSLSQLTDENMITDEIYKFLSQVGEYTLSLVSSQQQGKISEEDYGRIRELYEYSKSLSSGMDQIRAGCLDGSVSLMALPKSTGLSVQRMAEFSGEVSDVEQSLTDYPTLIYDGPFADSVLNKKGGKMLEDLNEITLAEAKKNAAAIIGCDEKSLRREKDRAGNIELYCFSLGDTSVGITKKGGKLCYLLSPAEASEETISSKEAVKRAAEYLKKNGYENMKESYYSRYDGVCTVNFAAEEEGVIYYSDLIKVSVALDSGKVLSLDASGYLTNHCTRNRPTPALTREQAAEILSPELSVISSGEALIPLDTGKEAFCYEFRCKDISGNEALVYIDTETGKEQNILLLLYSDGGTLTR
ncbi:MAG: germination protein YpeB [Oscillospiraceae bacterium]|nr:germination protein YpeB [Oscillospiraceae bacterium]